MAKLKEKVAVVTGASKGIGAGIAEKLGAEGASVVVNYASDKPGADGVVQRIQRAGGKAVAFGSDLSKEEGVRELFAQVKKEFGTLDILVNNAGVYEFRSLNEIDSQHFYKHFDLNVLGLLLAARRQSPALRFTPLRKPQSMPSRELWLSSSARARSG